MTDTPICVTCGKPATGECEGLPADIKALADRLHNAELTVIAQAFGTPSAPTLVSQPPQETDVDVVICQARARIEDQARTIDAMRRALVQARGALLLDAMVDENGNAYGTTMVALKAIDTALVEPVKP